MTMNAYVNTLYWAGATVLFIAFSSLAVASLARWLVRARGATRARQEATFAGYLFVSPWLVGFFIFVLAPMLASFYWSFTKYNPPAAPAWVGLQNYVRIITQDKDFRSALFNTLFLTLVGLPAQLIVALGLAMLLNRKIRGERLFRMAFYLPVVLGLNAAVLLSWRLMFNANTGLINTIIRGSGNAFAPFNWLNRVFIYVNEFLNGLLLSLQNGNFGPLKGILAAGFPAAERVPLWLQSPLWTKTSIILLMVWSCGAMMLIYLAALTAVPREIYEAADVDGVTGWQKFRFITLPLISPATFYNLVVGTIATIQIFEQPYVLYRDTPTVAQSAYSVVYTLWRSTFRFNEMGYGAAISWLLLLLLFLITVIQFRLQGRWVQYDVR